MLLCRNRSSPSGMRNTICDSRTAYLDERRSEIRGRSMFRTDLFKGKRFLVTGGGTGLGRIMMERFVELGADCVICGRRGAVLEETAKQVMDKHPGRRVETHTVDIRVATA